MWRLFKVGFSLSAVIALAYTLGRLADEVSERPRLVFPSAPRVEEGAKSNGADAFPEGSELEGETVREEAVASLDEAWRTYVEEFDRRAKAVELRQTMEAWPLERVVTFFGDALALGLESGEARLAAGVALESMAEKDPSAAVAAFSALLPIDKEALAGSIAEGWTRSDPLSAWDWIESAWLRSDGIVFDRSMQSELLNVAMDALLHARRDLPLAATLTSLTPDRELKRALAEKIAAFIVANEPEEMVQGFEFEGDRAVDQAIMDEVMREWAGRDALGAIDWFVENGAEVSSVGATHFAKQLLAQDMNAELQGAFARLERSELKDAMAAEAARLLARRDPIVSANWLQGVSDSFKREAAFWNAVDEIGEADLRDAMSYLALSYPQMGGKRLALANELLGQWKAVDDEAVASYLNSGKALTSEEKVMLQALLAE